MRTLALGIAVFSLWLAFRPAPAGACGAQVPNRYFLEARGAYGRLDTEKRGKLVTEWSALDAEQKELWRMAGDVDAACGRNEPYEDIKIYHSRVLEWEEKLRAFLDQMKNMATVQVPVPAAGPRDAPSPSPQPDTAADPAAGAGAGASGSNEISFDKPAVKKPAPKASEPKSAAPLILH